MGKDFERPVTPSGNVSTVAGDGTIGSSDSPARFDGLVGITVDGSTLFVYVADTGNHVLRRVLLPPSIASFTPTRGNLGSSVTITGERFDGRAPSRNTVRFTRTGGGFAEAVVTFASRTQLIITVPADAATGPITVQTEGGSATSAANFEVIANTPIISDFNPKNGTVGAEVTLTGAALKADTGPTVVTFAGGNNSRLPALVTFVTPTSVRALVPNGAVTGVIDLTNNFGHAATATAFTVDPGQNDYRLTIAPSSTTAVQASTATFVVFFD